MADPIKDALVDPGGGGKKGGNNKPPKVDGSTGLDALSEYNQPDPKKGGGGGGKGVGEPDTPDQGGSGYGSGGYSGGGGGGETAAEKQAREEAEKLAKVQQQFGLEKDEKQLIRTQKALAKALAAGDKKRAERLRKKLRDLEQRIETRNEKEGLEDQFRSQLVSAYFEIWGVMPTPKYIDKAMEDGLNIYELIDREKSKPAFRHTKLYREQTANYAATVAEALGLR